MVIVYTDLVIHLIIYIIFKNIFL